MPSSTSFSVLVRPDVPGTSLSSRVVVFDGLRVVHGLGGESMEWSGIKGSGRVQSLSSEEVLALVTFNVQISWIVPEEGRHFAHVTQKRIILSITGSLRFINKMEVEVVTSKSVCLNSSNIWLFCIEKDKYSVSMRDCPSVQVNARVAHISPADKPLIRRRVLMADSSCLTSLYNQPPPQLLLITNSCDFKFNKDAVSKVFSDGTDSLAVLIWSFVMIPGAQLRSQPDHCNAVDLPGMPANAAKTKVCHEQITRLLRKFLKLVQVKCISSSKDVCDVKYHDRENQLSNDLTAIDTKRRSYITL
ncbi:unnamed protein product [Mytilus edulis]|uniref:Uncharacterized protein n=1 Tax=Mytilus edulis TaxID=6550 RepID=A0A8S3TTV3_MYTED|nr:unnamed protein product [Mytilus edulis]